VADFNFDHPNAFDWESIEKVIDEVLVGKDFYIPTYDFCTNSR
jgi:uridine kinase